MRSIHIALLSAMPEEIGTTLEHLKNIRFVKYGDLKIYSGEWKENDNDKTMINISVAWSGWGKVSAARAATRLIASSSQKKPIDLILFTGVAGAADSKLKQWDVIIADKVIQHDMDARPLFDKYVIPALKKDKLNISSDWLDWIYLSLKKGKSNGMLDRFGSINKGLIATGDKFISNKNTLLEISSEIPQLKAIEMEGAAVAQVAMQENIPVAITRIISDEADNSAAQSFSDFLTEYKDFSWKILNSIFINYRNIPIND